MHHISKYIFLLFMLNISALMAQKDEKITPKTQRLSNSHLRNGNEKYEKEAFADAEVFYKKAISTLPEETKSNFNLGNAMMQQKRYKEAIQQFENAVKVSQENEMKSKAFHNIGNAQMELKDYQKAIDSYKNSLRINPKDEETRYNLALAQKYLKENPPKQNNQNKDQQNQQNQDNKQQPDQNKNNDSKGNKEKDKKEQPKDQNEDSEKKQNKEDENQNQPNQPSQGKMSEQQMKQLLDALNNEEKKTLERVKLQNVKTKPNQKEKDW